MNEEQLVMLFHRFQRYADNGPDERYGAEAFRTDLASAQKEMLILQDLTRYWQKEAAGLFRRVGELRCRLDSNKRKQR